MIKHANIEKLIKEHAQSQEEREELWRIVDEIVHHRIVGCVLDNLDKEHHQDFLEKMHDNAFEEDFVNYLESKTNKKVVEKIQEEIQNLESEILNELK